MEATCLSSAVLELESEALLEVRFCTLSSDWSAGLAHGVSVAIMSSLKVRAKLKRGSLLFPQCLEPFHFVVFYVCVFALIRSVCAEMSLN